MLFRWDQDNHQTNHIPEAVLSLLAKAYSGFTEVYLGQHTDDYLPHISILRETSALNVKSSLDLYQLHPQSDS